MKNIFVSGSAAYDEIMDFPHHFKDYFHPEKLHQINVSFSVDSLAKHLGGCATNIVYALKNTRDYYKESHVIASEAKQSHINVIARNTVTKQSSHDDAFSIYPVAAVGRDGGELVEFFRKNNIDTTFVQQDKKLYTATGKVITDKNDNQIWGFYYGACALNPKLGATPHTLPPTPSSDFWIISATHERPFTTTLRYVIKNKLPYLFDPGMTLTWIRDDLLRKGVMHATYIVGNDYEIAMIEKRLKMTVKEIVESGVGVITTFGKKGVRIQLRPAETSLNQLKPAEQIFIKAIKLKKVVDPTGAGDAWRGGFVGALAAGKSIRECLVMGNVMASFAVQTVGTVEYQVTKSEIEKRVKALTK